VEIVKVQFLNEQGLDVRLFTSGETVKIVLSLRANEDVNDVVVGILLRDRFGQDIFGTNTHYLQRIVSMKEGERLDYEYSFPLNIGIGKYTLSPAVHKDATHVGECYHWWDAILNFEVTSGRNYYFVGLAKLDVHLEIKPYHKS
jgi:lipopolysaccharide transport system ATP-binding protein